jgi:hypothetical protein
MMETIEKVQSIITRQRALLGETKQEAKNITKMTNEQKGIRSDLQDVQQTLSQKLPLVPGNFGRAGKAMEQSAEKLGGETPTDSIPDQETAIRELEDMQQGMSQQMMSMMQQMIILQMPPTAQAQGQPGQDGQGTQSEQFDVPNSTREKLRKILNLIRDRAGSGRPKEEREYFERLLRQF